MFLIVGLGNPGKQYAGSRHNLGFQVIEKLSSRLEASAPSLLHQSLYSLADYRRNRVILAQPLTYMNRSGSAVVQLARRFEVELSHILIICDDLDLPPGVIRLRQKGGSAGHRGVQSIIDALNAAEFPRLRIGIGKPLADLDTVDYVLRPLEPPDRAMIEEALDRAVDAVLTFIEFGLERAMNDYNRPLPPATG